MSLQSLALLQKFVRRGELTVIDHEGERHTFGTGEPRAAIRLSTASAFGVMARNPGLKLGEAYMDGLWDVAEGTLHDVLTLLRINLEAAIAGGGRWQPLRALLTLPERESRQAGATSATTTTSTSPCSAPASMRPMHYSCAYFRNRGMTLEEAQHAKSEHIAAKLHLRPGHRVLDIGCGWGSLAMHLAENHDRQGDRAHTVRRAASRRPGNGREPGALATRWSSCCRTTGNTPKAYDRIVSVGMFEHVGKQNVQRFFDSGAPGPHRQRRGPVAHHRQQETAGTGKTPGSAATSSRAAISRRSRISPRRWNAPAS